MTSSHQQIIEAAFAEHCDVSEKRGAKGRLFVEYCAHLVLQKPPLDVDSEALLDGIVDSSLDGGVDAVYTLFNGEVQEGDSDIVAGSVPASARQGRGRLDVFVIQTKLHGVGTTAIEKLIANLPRLMSLSDRSVAEAEFNELVLDRFGVARKAWRNLASFGGEMNFHVVIGTLTDIDPVSDETRAKVARLETVLRDELAGATTVAASVEGARGLLSRQRRIEPTEFNLHLERNFASGVGLVALVNLREYASFVGDGSGQVRQSLLEDNVRDYQGQVEVNSAIWGSLQSAGATPFWWLNNGITIVCKSYMVVGEELRIVEPRVVNGLQTTRVVHDYLSQERPDSAASQLVLIRVLASEDQAQRDSVIRATNSQTAVDSASLRATDEIQKHIEEHFERNNLYYDRRKGSFKDQHRTGQVMLSIRDLGQALAAVILARPDLARGRPTSLLKDDERYARLFNERTSLVVYLFVARVWMHVGEVLQSEASQTNSVQRRYLKMHLIAAVISQKLRKWVGRGGVPGLAEGDWLPSNEEVLAALQVVQAALAEYIAASGSSLERATKAQPFTTHLASLAWGDSGEEPMI